MGFAEALPIILAAEGGYVHDPLDHGGATNHGITQRSYDAWRSKQAIPLRGVDSISDKEVADIYLQDYWNAGQCPVLPWPLSLVHFDARVNHRPERAVMLLQQAVGAKVDGILGPATLATAIGSNPISAADKHCDAREQFYQQIVNRDHTQEKFLKGWLHRLDRLRAVIHRARAA